MRRCDRRFGRKKTDPSASSRIVLCMRTQTCLQVRAQRSTCPPPLPPPPIAEWTSSTAPDPTGEQFAVLKDTLGRLKELLTDGAHNAAHARPPFDLSACSRVWVWLDCEQP